jgi:hypothetical protein
MDEDRDPVERQLSSGTGVVRMAVGADDPGELGDTAAVALDDRGDPGLRPGVSAVDERQLRLENEVGLDPPDLDRFDIPNGAALPIIGRAYTALVPERLATGNCAPSADLSEERM